MRRLPIALGFCLGVVGAAIAQETPIPLLTGPQDVGSLTATVNTLIRQINATAVSGPTFNPVTEFGAVSGGTVDATEAIQKAQAACAAVGGGQVSIAGYRLLVNSADITIAANCPIVGTWIPQPKLPGDYSVSTSAIVINPTHTINVGQGAALRGVLVLSSGLPALPTTAAQGAAMVAGFSGVGITQTGSGARLEDVQVLGFATAILSNGHEQFRWNNVRADSTSCVSIIGSHDQSNITALECWPYLTASQAWTKTTTTMTGAADNGAGIIRLTVTSTAAFTTGNTLFVYGMTGFSGANSKPCVNATVVSATQIDCPGLSSAPTATAAVVSGSKVITLTAPDPAIHGGQAVTDTTTGGNIPGATTVTFVSGTKVYLNNAAAGTGAADTIAFANSAYVSGGIVLLDNDYRSGTGMYLEDNDFMQCSQCFVYGYAVGFDLNGDLTDTLTDIAFDSWSAAQDSTSIGVRVGGAAYGNQIRGSYIVAGQPIIGESSITETNSIAIQRLFQTQNAQTVPAISLTAGRYQVNDSSIQTLRGSYIYVDSAVAKAQFCNDDFAPANFFNDDSVGYLAMDVCPGVIFNNGAIASRRTISGSTNGSLVGGATLYIGDGIGNSTAELNASFVPLESGTISGLVCLAADPTAGQSRTYTVRTPSAGGDSAVTCTQAAGAVSCVDFTHTTPATGGTRQALKLVASATAANSNVNCSFRLSAP